MNNRIYVLFAAGTTPKGAAYEDMLGAYSTLEAALESIPGCADDSVYVSVLYHAHPSRYDVTCGDKRTGEVYSRYIVRTTNLDEKYAVLS